MLTAQANIMQGRHCDAIPSFVAKQWWHLSIRIRDHAIMREILVVTEVFWILLPCCGDSLAFEPAERRRASCELHIASIFREIIERPRFNFPPRSFAVRILSNVHLMHLDCLCINTAAGLSSASQVMDVQACARKVESSASLRCAMRNAWRPPSSPWHYYTRLLVLKAYCAATTMARPARIWILISVIADRYHIASIAQW